MNLVNVAITSNKQNEKTGIREVYSELMMQQNILPCVGDEITYDVENGSGIGIVEKIAYWFNERSLYMVRIELRNANIEDLNPNIYDEM